MKPIIIAVVRGNVYLIAMAPQETAPKSSVEMDDGRVFDRVKIKYRRNGQMIYYYKQVDTTGK